MSTKPTSVLDRPLTKSQERAIAAVTKAREEEAHKIQAVAQVTYTKVAKALKAGVPAVVLASRLGVSRARIYQMRDQAEAD